ncbi:MAG: MBL fold metallo-hydrolase [Clostridia bacterium]|nr:MBL fold metallo-hydrolase [Clostridia bacterium]
MFGVSLSPDLFLPHRFNEKQCRILSEYGGTDALLRFLSGLGVQSVELRTVSPSAEEADVLACTEKLEKAGFSVTVHGSLPETVRPFSESYSALLPYLRQRQSRGLPPLQITLHAYTDPSSPENAAEKTNQILRLWSAKAKELGFRLSLELNRDKKNGDPSITPEGVLAMVSGTDPELVGICFDFGHYFSNTASLTQIPCPEFLSRVTHTHIHALGPGGTHFPFAPDTSLPLDTYVNALFSAGYKGIYNLELDFPRFPDRSSVIALRDSVTAIKAAGSKVCPFSERDKLAYARAADAAYPDGLSRVTDEYSASGENAFWPVCPSGYVFSLGGVKFALDPAIRSKAARSACAPQMARLLSLTDYVFITHDHDDHFDTGLIRLMGELPCKWVVGTNISQKLLADSGISREKLIFIAPGETLELPGIKVSAFEGCHFGHDGSGVDSVMYLISAGGKELFFPGDVRDYGVHKMPDVVSPDAMFANLWLGRGMALATPEEAYGEFCDYVAFFRPQRVFLGHLMEYTRSVTDMWRYDHSGKAAVGLLTRMPQTETENIRLFKKYRL